ncbi:MAG: DNA-directed RNA polymerase subunit omega [Lachnospiraceae bacterium]|nr:DNA-directed RNA polymerase subunit omega [Lachnospiraceae bacterium]
MLHPSYSDLMNVVNSDVEEGETPVVNSRYSIVMATSKRARQIIARQSRAGEDMKAFSVSKPLSKAVEELYTGQLKILPGEETAELES